MRTTITLEPDVEALVRKLMADRGLTFKQAVNLALREALAGPRGEPFSTPTFAMGAPAVPLDHALRVAAELEDAELRRKLSAGK